MPKLKTTSNQLACLDGVKFDQICIADVDSFKANLNLLWRTERARERKHGAQELATFGAFTLVLRPRRDGGHWLTVRGSINKQVNGHNYGELDHIEAGQALRGLFERLKLDLAKARYSSYEVVVNLSTTHPPDHHIEEIANSGKLVFEKWTRPNAIGATATASKSAYAVKLYAKANEGPQSHLRLEIRGQAARMSSMLQLPLYGLELRTAADLVNALTFHSDKLNDAFTAALYRRVKSLTYTGSKAKELKADLIASATHLTQCGTTPHLVKQAPKGTLTQVKNEKNIDRIDNLHSINNINYLNEINSLKEQLKKMKTETNKLKEKLTQEEMKTEKLTQENEKLKMKEKKEKSWLDYQIPFSKADAVRHINSLKRLYPFELQEGEPQHPIDIKMEKEYQIWLKKEDITKLKSWN